MASLNQSSPVAKTAFDSIQAKSSALRAGYNNMVTRNEIRYNELLETVTSELKVKRQTPLVNAGYAARVLAVSNAIDKFMQYHQHIEPEKTLQLIFLGCGMDVLGIWSNSLVEKSSLARIVELDVADVCRGKKDLLESKRIVAFNAEPLGGSLRNSAGIIINNCDADAKEPGENNFFLCPVDLRDCKSLDDLIDDGTILDPVNVPTLVISELVMVYMSKNETDCLLKWCASRILKNTESAMVALEPLGFAETESNIITVADGYRRDYCHLFRNKMNRGNSTDTTRNGNESNTFSPIGISHLTIETRLKALGFHTIHATSLGSAAAHTSAVTQFQILEIFDEHAALVLHLQSYTLVTAFRRDADSVFQRLMCPSMHAASEILPNLRQDRVICTVMGVDEEEAMISIFRKSYSNLVDKFPAVRKMVKGVLGREFVQSTNIQGHSEIVTRYKEQQGCFFIAMQYTKKKKKVVGCIGVSPFRGKIEKDAYEILRFAVDEEHRGQGIGRSLLETAEAFARSRSVRKVVANTITKLEQAMIVYESCGYLKEKDSPLGNLVLRTYSKQLLQ